MEGDLVILLSDGVVDNLDPEYLGLFPRDLASLLPGLEMSEVPTSWSAPSQGLNSIKATYRSAMLKKLIAASSPLSPSSLTHSILTHCTNVTASSRQYLRDHPTKYLVTDHVQYPGKLDHATCLVYQVTSLQSTSSSSSSSLSAPPPPSTASSVASSSKTSEKSDKR